MDPLSKRQWWAVLGVLVEKFGIAPIGTPQEDLEAILA